MSQALGTMRPDLSDSLLPAKRMPMGLIEHSVNFFTAEHVNEVLYKHIRNYVHVYILCVCMWFTYYFPFRSNVHLTINLSFRLCMYCLVPNCVIYLVVPLGVIVQSVD